MNWWWLDKIFASNNHLCLYIVDWECDWARSWRDASPPEKPAGWSAGCPTNPPRTTQPISAGDMRPRSGCSSGARPRRTARAGCCWWPTQLICRSRRRWDWWLCARPTQRCGYSSGTHNSLYVIWIQICLHKALRIKNSFPNSLTLLVSVHIFHLPFLSIDLYKFIPIWDRKWGTFHNNYQIILATNNKEFDDSIKITFLLPS